MTRTNTLERRGHIHKRASYTFAMSVDSNRLIAPPCGWPCMHASITRHHHSLRAAADLLGPVFPLNFRTSVAIQSSYGVLCSDAKSLFTSLAHLMVHIVGFTYVAMSAAPGTRPATVYMYDAVTPLHYTSGELISSDLPWCTLSQQLYRILASAFDGLHTACPAAPPLGLLCTPAHPSRRATVVPSRR